jgi:hypothetical protein
MSGGSVPIVRVKTDDIFRGAAGFFE